METILRYDAMKLIDSGELFDLVFITADRKRGTGGQIRRLSNWAKIKSESAPTPLQPSGRPSKNPSHGDHKTVNIYNPSNPAEHAVKVHWRLMVFLNGKRILQ